MSAHALDAESSSGMEATNY